ncbi:MAG TPA: methyltransferase domain-containing protein [Gemmatimonadaceae bacterium]|nr:methyltransferase domain-containing protein [Gemmatimonadaceae bacterium]
MIWRCPGCHGELELIDSGLRCEMCGSHYDVVDGIPDLRHPPGSPDYTADRDEARRMVDSGDRSPEKLVRAFFAAREGGDGWTATDTETRTRQTLISPARLQTELDGWLQPLLEQGAFLDLGCGLGGLLTAAARKKARGIGIDNRMTVLVVAKRLIESNGGEAVLACARAEAMPLADGVLGGVVMYDVIEHVDNLEQVLAEVSRVTGAGGMFACSTPNRFSIAPEPHVHLWGVGWLPRRFQAAYVKRVSGRSYEGTRLLSPGELSGLVRRNTEFDPQLELPQIPAEEMAVFKGPKKILGRIYNSLAHLPLSKPVLLRIGAFFQLVAVKRS